MPPLHVASAPQYRGMLAYRPASLVVIAYRARKNGNSQLKQIKNVKLQAKY
jgi:hypothetical protein